MTARTQHKSGRSPQPSFPDGLIIVSPVGGVPANLCRAVAESVTVLFGCPTRVASLVTDIAFAFDRDRNQYHSTPILEALAAAAPAACHKILGLTEGDLYIPILTYVFGEAQLNGRACIVSTSRLAEDIIADNRGLERRLIKEAVHELGHTFNLRHCEERTCIMHYCRGVRDVDRKARDFCRHCRVMLSDEIRNLSAAS